MANMIYTDGLVTSELYAGALVGATAQAAQDSLQPRVRLCTNPWFHRGLLVIFAAD